MISIVGRSGVGKTSILRLVSGEIEPTSGSVSSCFGPTDICPASFGLVEQDYRRSLFPWFSVSKNIRLAMGKSGLRRGKQEEVVDRLLETLGIAGIGKKFPSELSGGMQQRVALARALVGNPKLLLLDEPFASVDALVRLELQGLCRRLMVENKIAGLLVTHDVEEAVYMGDEVLVLGPDGVITDSFMVDLGPRGSQINIRLDSNFREQVARVLRSLGL